MLVFAPDGKAGEGHHINSLGRYSFGAMELTR